jgi:predicted outer membrane repeat protein
MYSPAARWYVKVNATGANSGLSWTDAYTDLQLALGSSSFGDEIWVAAGTYKPTSTTSATTSFNLVNGVAIYGGFYGTETLLTERDLVNNICTLSGNIGNGSSTTDNSNHVVYGDNVGNQTRLDGFRISDGHASSLAGGVYLSSSSPTISNCTFINNFALDAAGALTHNGGTLTLTNCVFLSNFTDGIGGALQIRSGTARITDCRFTSNQAGNTGGALYLSGGVSYIDRCIFDGNSAETNSGVIYHLYDNSMYLSNSLVVGNYAPQNSIMYMPPISNSQMHSIVNCTFANNRQTQNSGIAYPLSVNSHTEIANSIFWDNGGAAAMYPNANAHDCLIQGGFSSGTAIISANPSFIQPELTSQAPFSLDGFDYHVSATSPVIDKGVNNLVVAPADKDLDLADRIYGPRADIGAYELSYCNLSVNIETESTIPFCPQTTQTLSASAGDNYTWYQGTNSIGSGNSISVTTGGTYVLQAADASGCRGGDTIQVTFSSISFLITGTTTFCSGESNTLSLSGDYSNPVWNNSVNADQFVVTNSGNVNVTAQTSDGCEVDLSTNITVLPLPNPNINWVSNHLNAGSGFSSYQWYLDGVIIPGANSANYTPTANGDYTVLVSNVSGCDNTSAVYTFNSLGIEPIFSKWKMYPQPAADYLILEGIHPQSRWEILDASGRIVLHGKFDSNSVTQIQLSTLNSGLYLIRLVQSDKQIITSKLIHQ